MGAVRVLWFVRRMRNYINEPTVSDAKVKKQTHFIQQNRAFLGLKNPEPPLSWPQAECAKQTHQRSEV
jgi:hypothetical protein